jgi:hypothetical protein
VLTAERADDAAVVAALCGAASTKAAG